ncbi:MAG TPA: hypothetical protein VGD73_12630 [Pseudonocardia sp.]|uniref:hypothetical protein n=1 Tax=Pseudonocardia sp. TaxID=60912 RepID=UPI002ED92269
MAFDDRTRRAPIDQDGRYRQQARPHPRPPAPSQPPGGWYSEIPPPRGRYGEAAAPEGKRSSFTVSKVLAGGLAASTSAVCGSYFGAFGTVGGAAAGSVATALSSEIYQRFLERTRDRLRPRSRPDGGRSGYGPPSRSRMPAPSPPARGRLLPRLLVVSLVIFAVGMGVVTGIEWARGEPLSGESHGTSLGGVLGGDLGSTVDGLLGGSPSAKQDSGDGQQRPHGIVGGLLSGLTG